jgi:hypothetical protein
MIKLPGLFKMRRIIGFCGRIDSGKTYAANFITPNKGRVIYKEQKLVNYVSKKLLLTPNTVRILFPSMEYKLDQMVNCVDLEFDETEWIHMSMATPLKLVISNMFNIDFEILEGTTRKEERNALRVQFGNREISCRELMEIVGTNILRNYNTDVFVNSVRNSIRQTSAHIVISDIRFPNELKICNSLYLIYSQPADLVITDADRKSHISQWGFLQFQDKAVKIQNAKDESFNKKLKLLI